MNLTEVVNAVLESVTESIAKEVILIMIEDNKIYPW